ncbi:MAG: DUF3108 domain-containing protein [Hyphomonadaceae bacterium]|nr:DUF3108 domain-containing protein [Hyphomonadaceae bacterium]
MIRGLACLAALAAVLCATPAAAQTFRLEYQATAYGLFSFGRASIEANVAAGDYTANASLRTAGLAALVAKARANAVSRGAFSEASGMAPARYDLDHEHYGHRTSFVDWTQPGVALGAAPIFRDRGNPPASEEQRREGRDPLATLLTMGAQVERTRRCDGVFRVFDGLYVYDLALRHIGEGRYRRGALDWPVIRCELSQRRIAGYASPEALRKKDGGGELWFAIRPNAPFAIPVRVSSRLPLGVAAVSLSAFEED